MKKYRKILICLTIFSLLVCFFTSNQNEITTESKKYLSGNNDSVSTRELALLASLVYEDVPNDSNYEEIITRSGESENKNGCISDGKLKNNCFFTNTSPDAIYTGTKHSVKRYIEGFSDRKMESLVSFITTATVEPGEYYYFMNFADVSELKGWEIYDFSTIQGTKFKNSVSWSDTFDAITFKRGNNYVIAYRGTDFPDLYEWLTDFAYAVNGANNQTMQAYYYAQNQYEKILKKDNAAKIYVTGHSLGGYLAQVGGAALVDYEAGKICLSKDNCENDPQERNTLDTSSVDFSTNDVYKDAYSKTDSHIEQVAYFNGMGVNGLLENSKLAINLSDALVYLSTHDKKGNYNNTERSVNYADDVKSSGRLVLYSMNNDPISSIGLHFGEIYKFDIAADAITNHLDHSLSGEVFNNYISSVANKINDAKIIDIFKSISEYIRSNNGNLATINNQNKIDDYLPKFVSNKVGSIYSPSKYDAKSVLLNILRGIDGHIDNYYDKAEGSLLKGAVGYFNSNHETDSFICLMDKDHGAVTADDITLSVTTQNMKNCSDENKCRGISYNSTTTNYGYKYGDLLSKYSDKPGIVLTADVKNSCAKKYKWFYRVITGNSISDWNQISETINNQIIVKGDDLGIISSDKKLIEFKVEVTFGDNYKESKLVTTNTKDVNVDIIGLQFKFNLNTNFLSYETKNSTPNNPTLDDGNNLNIVNTIEKESANSLQIGDIDVALKSDSSNMHIYGMDVYTNKKYDDNNNIVLNSNVRGNWYYINGENEILIKENSNNVTIPKDYIKNTENTTNKYTFKISNQIVEITYNYDTTAPVCNFSRNNATALSAVKGWLIKKYTNSQLDFPIYMRCSENIKYDGKKEYFSSDDGTIKVKSDLSFLPDYSASLPLTIGDKAKKNPTSYLYYNGGITDLAGNVDTNKDQVKITRIEGVTR